MDEKIFEAVLFASGELIHISKLAALAGCDAETAACTMRALLSRYEAENGGVLIIEANNAFQMCTNPKYYEYVKQHMQLDNKKQLTQPLLETLAIIAYRQPITKSGIEEIRGVSAEHAVNRLLDSGLICETGRLDAPGRPILFGTSEEFLKYFGLRNAGELKKL